MLGKLDFCMLNPFCSTNVYGLATLNTPKEKILILGLLSTGVKTIIRHASALSEICQRKS